MNTTITILLSVSALYIVVFQNIPMIGEACDVVGGVSAVGHKCRVFVVVVVVVI